MNRRSVLNALTCGIGLLGLTAVALAQPLDPADVPGGRDAVRSALEQACEEVVNEFVETLPSDVDTIAVLPFENDEDGTAARTVEDFLIKYGPRLEVRIVARGDPAWERLTTEWEFAYYRSDVIPPELIPTFREVLPAGAVVWGSVRTLGLNDTGIRAQAIVEARMGSVTTGQIVASGTSEKTVQVATDTFLIGLIHKPWFWPVAGIVGVALIVVVVVFIFLTPPVLRGLFSASKPRRVAR
jgi:hypothetical protein